MTICETRQPGDWIEATIRGAAPDDIVADLARDLRKRFNACQRMAIALGAMHSLSPDSRLDLVAAAERMRKAEDVFRRARHG